VDLTANTISNADEAPTVTDNLFSQGTIPENLVAVSFEPATDLSAQNGELTFGSIDPTKFTGNITFT
jgi:cathepsin E